MAEDPSDGKPMETFETSLDELEKVVKELEGGDLSLERSLELFERGMGLSDTCRKTLEQAEPRVEMLPHQRGQAPGGAVPARKVAKFMTLREYLAQQQQLVDRELDRLVPPETT